MEMTIYNNDCLEQLKAMPDECIDSVVTDPPYGLAFMGKKWDGMNKRETEKMNELKVGEKRVWDVNGLIFEILYVGTKQTMIRGHDGSEEVFFTIYLSQNSTPYAEPVPVKRIVGHVYEEGLIFMTIDGSERCKEYDKHVSYKRIELTPEMFFGGEK